MPGHPSGPFTMTGPLRSSDHGYGNVTTRPLVDDGPQSCGDDRSHNEPHAPACPCQELAHCTPPSPVMLKWRPRPQGSEAGGRPGAASRRVCARAARLIFQCAKIMNWLRN